MWISPSPATRSETSIADSKGSLASIHADLAELRKIASADFPAPRRVRIKDVNGREQIICPLMVFHLAEDRLPAKTPGYELPVTILLYAASSGGNLVRLVLPGLPGAVATQLDMPFEQVERAPPVMVATVSSVVDANAAVAAITAKGSSVTDGNGDSWTIGSGGEALKSGLPFGHGFASEYAIVRGVVHALGMDERWYAIDGEGWALIGARLPVGALGPHPVPTWRVGAGHALHRMGVSDRWTGRHRHGLVARPAVSQTAMEKIMWPGFSTRPLTYRETRKSRLRLLNLKLAPMGLAVVSDAPRRSGRIACYRLNVEE